jgi:hypothetical protein
MTRVRTAALAGLMSQSGMGLGALQPGSTWMPRKPSPAASRRRIEG